MAGVVVFLPGAFALLVLPTAGSGQVDAPSLTVVAVDTTAAPETTVTVAVRRPPALREEPSDSGRFELREDGEPRDVEVVAPGDVQLEVWLLLDTSTGADPQMLSAARSAAVELVLALPASARIGVVGYGGDIPTLDPTSDRRAVTAAIGQLERRGQARFDHGVVAALQGRAATERVRTVLVALGAGANAGRTEVAQRARATELLSGTGVVFYVLHAGDGTAAAPAATLAGQVGGNVLIAERPSGLTGLADQVVRDLDNTFGLRYRSEASSSALVEVSYADRGVTAVASHRLEPKAPAVAPSPDAASPPLPGPETTASPPLPLPGPEATTGTPAAPQQGVPPSIVAGVMLALVAALLALWMARRHWWGGWWWRIPAATRARSGRLSRVFPAGAIWAGSVRQNPEPVARATGATALAAVRDTDLSARAAAPASVSVADSVLDEPAEHDQLWLDDDRELVTALGDVSAYERLDGVGSGGGGGAAARSLAAGSLRLRSVRRGPWRTNEPRTGWIAFVALAVAVAAAPVLVASPPLALLGVGCLAVVIVVIVHPPMAAYLLLALTPLIVGVDRGAVIPLLRPNEALAVLLGCGVALRALPRLAAQPLHRYRLRPVDTAIVLMAVLSSVIPLLWMAARGRQITLDDALYALTIWKYYGVYLIIRTSVRTERQVRACLWLSMAAAAVVAFVGIPQALNLFGVTDLLATYLGGSVDPGALENNRASSTLGSSHAVADVLTFNLAIAVGLLVRHDRHRVVLGAAAVLFVTGIVASGQVTGLIGLACGALVVGLITGRLTKVLGLLPVAAVASLGLAPVVARRLSSIDPSSGLPQSWLARLDNLNTYFWPELFSGANWVLGVRPSSQVYVRWPLFANVYIESGYTWLLWTGGVPLLLAYVGFLWVVLPAVARTARTRTDAVGVAAIAAFTAVVVTAVLMTLDPHLTMRGAADLSFALLALSSVAQSGPRRADGP